MTEPESTDRVLAEALSTENPHTDALSQQRFLDQDIEQPSWAPGPFREDAALRFELTGQWSDPVNAGWTSASIFNPSLIVA